jgi:long-subunit acyl-CoA synthetase (AMP-forming)
LEISGYSKLQIVALRPTVLWAPPRFWNVLHAEYNTKIATEKAKKGGASDEEIIKDVTKKVEGMLGGRVAGILDTSNLLYWSQRSPIHVTSYKFCNLKLTIVYIHTGGAAISQTVLSWLSEVFHCKVINIYGSSEVTGGCMYNNKVLPYASVKLIDCTDMGYTLQDKPHPRGEVLMRSVIMAPGYYKNEQATAEQFIEVDGVKWFRSGDIAEQLASDEFIIIDRIKNVFKLAQGEYVT